MKQIIRTIIILLLPLQLINSQWSPLPFPVIDISVYDIGVNNNNIFAGTGFYGIYKSTNDGQNWNQIGLNGKTVLSVIAIDSFIIAGTSSDGIYVSINNGLNWNKTLNSPSVYSFKYNGNSIFAACVGGINNRGVFKSTNNGLNWFQTSLNNRGVYSLAAKDSLIYAGTDTSGVYISTNNGLSWTHTSLYSKYTRALIIKDSLVFAGCWGEGVYISTNKGNSWSQSSLGNYTVLSLVIKDNIIFAATGDGISEGYGVYISTNNGLNWINKNEGMGNITVLSLLTTPNYILAGSYDNIWKRYYSDIIAITPISNIIPTKNNLNQNYPNPFNPATNIKFSIASKNIVQLITYDILGRTKETLVNQELNAGEYELTIDATNYSSGIYFYQLFVNNDLVDAKKMILIK